MKKQWAIPIALVALGILIIAVPYVQEVRFSTIAQQPGNWVFTMPEGNARVGQETFEKLQCGSCHNTYLSGNTSDTERPAIGPDLTVGYNNLSREYLAESIIKAHRVVADPAYVLKEGQAGMGKYNHVLTVQELIDVVEYLKQPPPTMAEK